MRTFRWLLDILGPIPSVALDKSNLVRFLSLFHSIVYHEIQSQLLFLIFLNSTSTTSLATIFIPVLIALPITLPGVDYIGFV